MPTGTDRATSSPRSLVRVSLKGSKLTSPAKASAITVSGEVTNARVAASPSFRLGKLRLYDVTMTLAFPGVWPDSALLSHCPMQGPQALASTVAPKASKSARRPSRSIVARICSDPGVTKSFDFAVSPWEAASRAMLAARVMSS